MRKERITLRNLKRRFSSETPDFWVKVRNCMIGVGAIGGAILAVPVTAPIVLPVVISTIAGYMVAIGSVGATLSQLTEK